MGVKKQALRIYYPEKAKHDFLFDVKSSSKLQGGPLAPVCEEQPATASRPAPSAAARAPGPRSGRGSGRGPDLASPGGLGTGGWGTALNTRGALSTNLSHAFRSSGG